MSREVAGFSLQTRSAGVLGVSGALDFATAASALVAIRGALGGVEQLDLSGVQRSDSAGLSCVLAVVAGEARQGRHLQVSGIPSGMQTLARVCEVESLLG